MISAKPTVLYITYDGLTDPLGQSQIIPYLKGLSKAYSITILSCEKKDRFQQSSSFIEKQLKEHGIQWSHIFYTKKPPVLSTVKDLWLMRKKARKLNSVKSFKIVHCRTVVSYLVGKKIHSPNCKLIFDMRGLWADERVDGKLWDLSKPLFAKIYNFFKEEQVQAYKNADAVISLTEEAKAFITEEYSIPTDKISVVPCNADQAHFLPKEHYVSSRKSIKKQLGLSGNELLIGYAGSLGTRYMLAEMLDCFKAIKNKNDHAIFLIITVSPLEDLKQLIHEKELSSSVIITGCNYQKMPEYLSVVDLALYFIYAGNSGKAVSPTKQAEFLSMGIPIITNSGIGDSKRIIENNHLGIVLDDLDLASYEKVADRLEELMKIPSAEIVKIANRFFSLESGVETYRSVYKKLH